MKSLVSKVIKKSEYSMIVSYISKNKYFHDSSSAEETVKLKNSL